MTVGPSAAAALWWWVLGTTRVRGSVGLVAVREAGSLASARSARGLASSRGRVPMMAFGRQWLAGQAPGQQQRLVESKAYDYIIAGGGTAGCVLANRLSSDPETRVLVVEAGRASPKHPYVRIPVAILKLFKSPWDWNFATEPAQEVAERPVYLCRGKGLGGSSCTNVMLYTRGAAADYDAWARECGDETWTASAMLPYFKRAETCLSEENSGVGEWHGGDGPAAVSDVPYQNPLSASFLQACAQAGLSKNVDFNDWSKPQVGFGRFQVSQRQGERESAASAYLGPDVLKRPNLDVVAGATVAKIVFDDAKRAVGVDLALDNSKVARASLAAENSEVLLTAGAIGSPHVLMLSGVGARDDLAAHGIPCVADRPGVGKNLQDHPACLVTRYSTPDAPKSHSSSLRLPATTATNPLAALSWVAKRVGPLTSPGCDHGAFLKLMPDSPEADTQFRFLASKSVTADGMSSIADDFKSTRNHPNGFTIQTILARPKSKAGSVSLASPDPRDKPTIRGGHFADPRDVDNMVAALREARRLLDMPALKRYAGPEEYPGSALTSDDDLARYARETVHTANALVGTCKLGKPDDPQAVVDNALRVIGTSNLRVCDSSVMPVLPGGQTASSTIAVAEKAADMLKHADLGQALAGAAPAQHQKVAA